MVTKGTFKAKDQNYEAKFVLSIKKHGAEVGVCFFDVTTSQVCVGQFQDDDLMTGLRTLSCQIRPVEVIHERDYSSSDVVKMLKA